ncbi:MAG TPA: SdpI family protein [Gemmatimonadales bacterium]|jgi:hypothetical protein|nr:SdpI family protein [Gemmatimonadales bacterium]
MREQVTFTGIAIVSVAVGLPLAARRIGRNRWYGLRVPAAFASEQVWYEANAAMGRDLVVVGCVLLVVALALPRFHVSRVTYSAVCGAVLAIGSLVATTRGWRLANRLAASRPRQGLRK